jgi:hypothetical protein
MKATGGSADAVAAASAVSGAESGVLLAAQLGREPRRPWRIAAWCAHGRPQVIVSPSRLADGDLFPSWAWLTCPRLCKAVAAEESLGACRRWTGVLAEQAAFAAAVTAVDQKVRLLRAEESGGRDCCATVGLAGQRDPLKVKCLHAHVAYYLAGLDDPLGKEFLSRSARSCESGCCCGEKSADLPAVGVGGSVA